MITSRLLHCVALVCLFVMFGACSGGDVQEPIEPQGVHTPEPSTPTEPPPVVQPPPPVNPMAGIWRGHLSPEGRVVYVMMVPDGRAWMILSAPNGFDDVAEGVILGTMTAQGTTWRMADGRIVDTVHHVTGSVDVSGAWLAGEWVNGTLIMTYTPPVTSEPPFAQSFMHVDIDAGGQVPFSLTQSMGDYRTPTQDILVTLDLHGEVSGMTAQGCTFDGRVEPNGRVAEGTITFHGGPCANGTATMPVVMGADRQRGKLYLAGVSNNQQQHFIFIGTR